MRCYLLLLLLLLCSCGKNSQDSDYQTSPKSELVDQISRKAFIKLKKDKNLFPCECGGRMMRQITLLHWGFDYYNEINIAEARELLIAAGDQMLAAFNADEQIRPYLATFPFTPNNIEIRIFLHKPNGQEIESDRLHVVEMLEGELDYIIRDNETNRLKEIQTESYDEAIARLKIGEKE